jgi:hypothetical protein
MVFSIQQAFCENEVSRNPAQDRTGGEVVGFEIESMIAVPLNFAAEKDAVYVEFDLEQA